MSRAIVIVIGVVLGLALAVLSSGHLGHLRSLAPSLIPGWMAVVDGQSSLWRGQAADLRVSAVPVSADLSWRFARLAAPGTWWSVTLSGPGLSAEAELGLPPARDRAAIRAGRAEILLGDWPPLIEGWPFGGLVTVTELSADLGLPSGQLQRISAALEWSNARLGGAVIGPGEAMLTSDSAGGWRAPFSLSGEGLAATGSLSGRLGDTGARLDLAIEPLPDLPEDMARALDRSAQALPGGGWRITREVDLGADWPLF